MEFLQVVQQRRAVRQNQSIPVKTTLIQRLINTAILAPSAMHLQPWSFAVVTGSSRIDEYARPAKGHLKEELGLPHEYHVVAPIVMGSNGLTYARADTGLEAKTWAALRSEERCPGCACWFRCRWEKFCASPVPYCRMFIFRPTLVPDPNPSMSSLPSEFVVPPMLRYAPAVRTFN
jgi:hypothetical protein